MPSESLAAQEQASLTPEQERHFWISQKRFPGRMEAEFQAQMERARNLRVRKTGVIAAVLYAAFAVSDWIGSPEVYRQAWQIRFLLVIPLILLCAFGIGKLRHPVQREVLLSATVIMSGVGLVWITSMSGPARYNPGIAVVVTFANIVLNLRFRDALITSGILATVYVASLVHPDSLPAAVRFKDGLFGLTIIVISLIANYRTDQDQRRAYRALRMLAKLSSEDALTKLANRREFDRRLELEWGHARRQGRPLALILIDVDAFKPYNDNYGHPAGDACLQRIADALRAMAGRSSDLTARFGGEEFAVLLPGAGAQEAAELAERLRNAILELQIPHAFSATAQVVSGSFGVCALLPTGQAQSSALLAHADAALYRAKEAGRNRVELYTPQAGSH